MKLLELLKEIIRPAKKEENQGPRPYTCPCCGQVVMPEKKDES